MDLMNLNEKVVDNNSVQNLMKELLDYSDEIPFGNSDFQNRHVIVDMEKSKHRAFRHASLRLMDRLTALNECYYKLREDDIEIKKLERKLNSEQDDLEKELIMIKIDKIRSTYPYTQKLIKDAIAEIKCLYPVIKSIGKLTKEEFEKGELEYFKEKYITQLSKNPVQDSLEVLGKNSLYDEIVGLQLGLDTVKEIEGKNT